MARSQFARAAEVSAGTKLRADGGFPCIAEGAVLTVEEGPAGLFIPCSGPEDKPESEQGQHLLNGQLEGGRYIGLYLAEPEARLLAALRRLIEIDAKGPAGSRPPGWGEAIAEARAAVAEAEGRS